jgi:hypothetical protein
MTSVIASASSFGIRACSRLCNGQTMAMMKSASASGANTVLASLTAAANSTAAMSPTAIFMQHQPP